MAGFECSLGGGVLASEKGGVSPGRRSASKSRDRLQTLQPPGILYRARLTETDAAVLKSMEMLLLMFTKGSTSLADIANDC